MADTFPVEAETTTNILSKITPIQFSNERMDEWMSTFKFNTANILAEQIAAELNTQFPDEITYDGLLDGTAPFFDLNPHTKDLSIKDRRLTDGQIIELFTNAEDFGGAAVFAGMAREALPSMSAAAASAAAVKATQLGLNFLKAAPSPYLKAPAYAGSWLLGTLGGYEVGTAITEGIAGEEPPISPSSYAAYEAGKTFMNIMPFVAQPYLLKEGVDLGAANFLSTMDKTIYKELPFYKKGALLTNSFIERFVNNTKKFYKEKPIRAPIVETGAATGAAIGAFGAETVAPGSTPIRLATELPGGVAGSIISNSLLNRVPSIISTLNEIRKGGLKEGLNVFKTKRQQQGVNRILELLEQAGEDPEEIIKALEAENVFGVDEANLPDDLKKIVQEGGKLTAAQITGSPTLAAIEAAIEQSSPGFGKQKSDADIAAATAFRNVINVLTQTGDKKALQLAAELKNEYIMGLLTDGYTKRVQRLLSAAEKVKGSGAATTDLGFKIRDAVFESLKEARKVEDSLWTPFKNLEINLEDLTTFNYTNILKSEKDDGVLPNDINAKQYDLSKISKPIKDFLRRSGIDIGDVDPEDAVAGPEISKNLNRVNQQLTSLGTSDIVQEFENIAASTIYDYQPVNQGVQGIVSQTDFISKQAIDKLNFEGPDLPGAYADIVSQAIDIRLQQYGKFMNATSRKKLKDVQKYARKLSEKARIEASEQAEAFTDFTTGAPDEPITIGSLIEMRSRVLQEARRLKVNNEPGSALLYKLQQAMLDDINNFDARIGDQTLKESYKEARAFSLALNDTYTRAFTGELRKNLKDGAEKLPPELLGDEIFKGGASPTYLRVLQLSDVSKFGRKFGLSNKYYDEQLKKEVSIPATITGALDQMIRNIRSTAIKSDGSINQEEVIKWVNKNKKLLEPDRKAGYAGFPELQEDLLNEQKAQYLLQSWTKKYASDDGTGKIKLTAIQKKYKNQTTFMDLLPGVENPTLAITKAYNSKAPRRDLMNLVNVAKRVKDPDKKKAALSGLRSSILEFAMVKGGMTSQTFNPRSMYDVLFSKVPNSFDLNLSKFMVDQGIATSKEVGQMKKVLEQFIKYENAVSGKGIDEVVEGFGFFADFAQRIAGAKIGTMIGGVVPGRTSGAGLIEAYAGSKMLRRMFADLPNSMKMDVMGELLQNPKLLASMMREPKNVGEYTAIRQVILNTLADLGLAPSKRVVPSGAREIADEEYEVPVTIDDKVSSVQPSALPSAPSAPQGPPPEVISPSLASASPIQPIAGPNVNQNQRAKLAAAFPFDIVSDVDRMKQAGIGSLMG